MKFSNVDTVRIPSGTAKKIRYNGNTLWEPYQMRYVSLGDSIAAGYLLDGHDESKEYGKKGNTNPTVILDKSYTGLVRDELKKRYSKVKATSFACSGDTVEDLMGKLARSEVQAELAKADLVTISIGANDVLQPALARLQGYLFGTVTESEITNVVQQNIANLNNDDYAMSYAALLNKLYSVNPNAKYVFTTVYNPYKYLYAYKGSSAGEYKDGFLGPLMWWVDPDGINDIGSALGFSGLAVYAREAILNTVYMTTFFTNANRMSSLTEGYVTDLNRVLKNKVDAFGKQNFIFTDTKAVYDPVPNYPTTSHNYYNDLVNVSITQGYVCEDMNWGELWGGEINWASIAWDFIRGDMSVINELAEKLREIVVENILWPNVDPHPRTWGHHALYCSFADALGWEALPRRTLAYNAGTYGTGSITTQTIIALDNMTVYTNISANAFTANTVGYRFTGWQGSNGAAYSDGQFVGLSGDLALTAQWSNEYTIYYRKVCNRVGSYEGQTGPVTKEGSNHYLAARVNKVDLPYLTDVFGSDKKTQVREYKVKYGDTLAVMQINTGSKAYGWIDVNGVGVTKSDNHPEGDRCGYAMQVGGDLTIEFFWEYMYDWGEQSYWNTEIMGPVFNGRAITDDTIYVQY